MFLVLKMKSNRKTVQDFLQVGRYLDLKVDHHGVVYLRREAITSLSLESQNRSRCLMPGKNWQRKLKKRKQEYMQEKDKTPWIDLEAEKREVNHKILRRCSRQSNLKRWHILISHLNRNGVRKKWKNSWRQWMLKRRAANMKYHQPHLVRRRIYLS